MTVAHGSFEILTATQDHDLNIHRLEGILKNVHFQNIQKENTSKLKFIKKAPTGEVRGALH